LSGIGYASYHSMVNGDIPFTMFYLAFISILTLLGNLIADVLYAVVDPRVQRELRRLGNGTKKL
jgi:peptide/nickel transport system permease protein